MRPALLPSCLALLMTAAPAGATESPPRAPLVDQVIQAAGADQLEQIESIAFTFSVSRAGKPLLDRRWRWHLPTDEVEMQVRTSEGDQPPVKWSRRSDKAGWSEAVQKADAGFINDTFWLSPPLHLSWAGPEVGFIDHGETAHPAHPDQKVRRLEVAYPADGGGYTPGDAYDLFLDPTHHIVAWHFRKGGAKEPSMTSHFTQRAQAGPLSLALDHPPVGEGVRIQLKGVVVQLKGQAQAIKLADPTP